MSRYVVRLALALSLVLGAVSLVPSAGASTTPARVGPATAHDTVPVTTILTAPDRISVDTSPSFTFEASPASPGLAFVCTLTPEGGTPRVQPCPAEPTTGEVTTGTASYDGFAPSPGRYTFTVQAVVPGPDPQAPPVVTGPLATYRWRVYSVASPMTASPTRGATFNNPLGKEASRRRNLSQVISTVKSMPGYTEPATSTAPCPTLESGLVPSIIRITLYSMTDMRFAQAMVDAARRCVSVQILMNNHLSATTDAAWKLLQDEVGNNVNARSFARRCSYGCRGRGVLHSKTYLFDSSVPKPGRPANLINDTVMVGSSNMTQNAAGVQWNDLYTVRGDSNLFGQFRDYFDLMKKDDGVVHRNAADLVDADRGIRTTFWPIASGRVDPETAALRSVSCTGATGGTGIGGRSIVYVNMHAWFGIRGLALADQVRRLYARGCYVRILYSFMTKRVYNRLTVGTGSRMRARRTIFSFDGDRYAEIYSHFKNILISGRIGSDTTAQVVWTGSANFTSDTTRYDEVTMRITSASAFRAYRDRFDYITRRMSSPQWAAFLEPIGGGRAPGDTVAGTGAPLVTSPDVVRDASGAPKALD